ncbi:MAG TPA: MlaD family protein [Steroidobacteraceae bacterium]|jgi:paraquat-inducible protein B
MVSEQPEKSDRGGGPGSPERVQAGVRHGWWPGWIWAIPIAALLVVIWLGARALLAGGTDVTILFNDVHGMKKENTDVVLRGTQVGHVKEVALTPDGSGVVVTASIDEDAVKFLTTGTRFWLQGANPSLSNLSSLSSLLAGPTIVMDPGRGGKSRHFRGFEQQPINPAAGERPILYEVSLDSEAGSLAGGDPVTLRGFTVGEVRDVGFAYDPGTGEISTPATLAIYPSLFHAKGSGAAPNGTEVAAEIGLLISKGMRARLTRNPPLVGSYQVSLQIMPGTGAPTGSLVAENGLPLIPTASGGGIADIINRINKVPIERIAQNALRTTHNLAALTSSPKLKDAVAQLDAALRQIHGVTAKAGPQITPLIKSLRRAAADLEGTAKSANHLVSGTATQNGLADTIQEVTEAARAVRSLADYLDRHPEALVRGRGDNSP